MTFRINILVGLFFCISSVRVKAQDCYNIHEFTLEVRKQIRVEFSKFDSLDLTYFVKYRVNSKGKINSVWISGIDFIDTDYDKYIRPSNGEPLNRYYEFQKKENEIRKRIYLIYKNSQIKLCEKSKKGGYFLQPIYVRMLSDSLVNFRNIDASFFALQNTNYERLLILKPLKIIGLDPNGFPSIK